MIINRELEMLSKLKTILVQTASQLQVRSTLSDNRKQSFKDGKKLCKSLITVNHCFSETHRTVCQNIGDGKKAFEVFTALGKKSGRKHSNCTPALMGGRHSRLNSSSVWKNINIL